MTHSSLPISNFVSKKTINAVIGVQYKGNETFYVKRSDNMENYPGVWSLLSIQFSPEEIIDFLDLNDIQPLMNKMSEQRLGNVPVNVLQYISSTTCTENPIDAIVNLHLYRIEFEEEPILNPSYYSDSEWMTPEQYLEKRGDALCGSCIRMWSDYCIKTGLTDTCFGPKYESDD